MSDQPKFADRIVSVQIDLTRWVFFSNGFVAVARPDDDTAAEAGQVDIHLRLLQRALAVSLQGFDAVAVQRFVGPACPRCNDSFRSKCRTCGGEKTVEVTCDHDGCGHRHTCCCDNCDGRGDTYCMDSTFHVAVPGRFAVSPNDVFDLRLVGACIRAMPETHTYGLGLTSATGSGRGNLLVISSGNQIGLVAQRADDDPLARPMLRSAE